MVELQGFVENHFLNKYCWSEGIWIILAKRKVISFYIKEKSLVPILVVYFLDSSLEPKEKEKKKFLLKLRKMKSLILKFLSKRF